MKKKSLLFTIIALVLFIPKVYAVETVDCSNGRPKAQVGTSCYSSLNDALESANEENNTIKLLDDVSNYTIKISKDQTIVLDLNTHKITAPDNSWAIYNEGNLTITNGTVLGNSKSAAIRNNGKKLVGKSLTVQSSFIAIINNDVVAIDGVEQESGRPTLILEDSTINGNAGFSGSGLQLGGNANVKNVKFTATKGSALIRVFDGKTETEVVLDNLSTTNRGLINAGKNSTNDEHGIKVEIKNISENDKSKLTLSPEGDAVIIPDKEYADKVLKFALKGSTIIIPEGFYMDKIDIREGVNIKFVDGNNGKQILEKNEDGTYNIVKRADYSKIDKLLNEIEKLNKDDYTKDTWDALEKAILAVDYDKTAKEQDKVDAMASVIEKAMNNLVKIKKENTTINPNTGDSSIIYIIIGGISVLGIVTSVLYLKKNR